MKIAEKTLVILQYKLKVKTEEGKFELMEETRPEQPLSYLHGMGMMLPRFETEIEGMEEGDKFDFMIPVDEAHGQYDPEKVIDLPKSIFCIDGKFDDKHVVPGEYVPLVDAEGNRTFAEIVSIADETVKVDLNNPLAGEDLYFSGRIISVTRPTDEEIEKMMHGCGGCGGNCSGNCGGNCDGECGGDCNCSDHHHDECHCSDHGGKCNC